MLSIPGLLIPVPLSPGLFCPVSFSLRFPSRNLYTQLLKLLLIHLARRFRHKAGRVLNLRKCDYVTDTVSTHHQHDNAVQAISQTCMGRHRT